MKSHVAPVLWNTKAFLVMQYTHISTLTLAQTHTQPSRKWERASSVDNGPSQPMMVSSRRVNGSKWDADWITTLSCIPDGKKTLHLTMTPKKQTMSIRPCFQNKPCNRREGSNHKERTQYSQSLGSRKKQQQGGHFMPLHFYCIFRLGLCTFLLYIRLFHIQGESNPSNILTIIPDLHVWVGTKMENFPTEINKVSLYKTFYFISLRHLF